MSVVIETTLGDITVDLFLYDRPRACLNFLKLCKIKYYNYNLFHTISRGFIAQTGDPTGSRTGGESIYGLLDGPLKRYFEAETEPRIKHTKLGLISFVGNEDHMLGSQFFFTLGEDITYLDGKHCVFGEVVEGFDVLEVINEAICDNDDRPYQDIRITHTVVLDDPYPDPKKLLVPSRSPSPTAERLQGGRIAPDEEIDETAGKSLKEINEMQAEREAKARATILEMVGDIPDADIAPPENVLFVCKLNPITTDYDLDVIFSRFGKIKSCEVIRDKKTNDSLQYAFVEFEDQKSCEDAYFKMDNVLIDDRRIHVDFSQSVSKVKWNGKGRGVTYFDDKGRKTSKGGDIGKGNYKYRDRERSRNEKELPPRNNNKHRDRSRSPEQKYKRDDRFRSSHQNYDNNNKYRDRSRSPRRSRDRSRSPNRKKEDYRSYSRRTTDLSSKKTDWNYRERDSYKERQRKYEKSSREKDESRERERYRTVKCSKSPSSNSNSKDDNERNRKKVVKHRDISDDDDKKVMKKKESKMKEESSEDDSSTDNSSGNESRRKKHKKKKSKSKSNDKKKKKKKRKQNSSSDSE